MEKIKLGPTLEVSRIALGFWRLMDWNITLKELDLLVEESLNLGVTTIDHADIYGVYRCEEEFGRLIRMKPEIRSRMELITKCGIKLASEKFPDQRINHYDTSYQHIIQSVNQSLRNFHTDHIDLLLIHRPDPLMNPEETARAFYHLKETGKVLNFGVSNFTVGQFDMLNKHFGGQLVTNQVEFSPYCLEHFHNGNMDFFLKQRIHPMGWSPLAGGSLLNPTDEKGMRVNRKLHEVAEELGVQSIDKVIYAWILLHPSKVIPIVGSGKPERLKSAVEAMKLQMTREQWYEIFNASNGFPLP
jgi:predicted oxidoreductase